MRQNIAIEKFLESTYLKTAIEAGISESKNKQIVYQIIKEAIEHKFILVMLRSKFITCAKKFINKSGSSVLVGTVIDFPFGDSTTSQKIREAKKSISLGVDDLDFVADYNAFKAGIFQKFDMDILKGTDIALKNGNNIKWIIETGALSKEEIKKISIRINNIIEKEFSYDAKKVYIKTSTGYYGGSGATAKDIQIIKSSVNNLKIKASGGVSTFEQACQMIDSGADRIGTSKALQIIKKL